MRIGIGGRWPWIAAMSLAALAGSACLARSGGRPDETPVVATDAGAVRGAEADGIAWFKGIPYAAPPVGPLRWRPTAPAQPWQGVRDARAFGAICPQPEQAKRAGRPQSEDCLTLNVASPKPGGNGKAPVLVLVHGGAYFVGSSADGFDDAARIFTKRGIVVVAPNYRLGRLGFFAHPGLRAEQPDAPVANYWLMDQIAALRWVKRNIAAFGGDPARVTILGCSAGGSSINALMASPKARGLFAAAQAHSGGGINNATRPLARAEQEGIVFAQRAGVTGEGGDAIARLRALTPAAVLAADPGAPNFGAIIDGVYLKEEIARSFAEGRAARVPFVAGSTSNEASIFGLMAFDEAVLKQRFDIDLEEARPAYDPAGTMPRAELLRQVETDFLFTAGATGLAGLAAKWQPAYAYHFAYVPPVQRSEMPGAPHCADMRYTFGDPEVPEDAESRRVAALLEDSLEHFVKTGDPNGTGVPGWPRYTAPEFAPLVIDRETAAVPGFRKRQIDYWLGRWSRETGIAYPR